KERLAQECAEKAKKVGDLKKEVRHKSRLEIALYLALFVCVVAVYLVVDLTIKLVDMGEPIVANMIEKAVNWWPAFVGAIIIPFAKHIIKRFSKKKQK
ncbi:MAG: hypothetical protein IIX09_00735, partial [Clostridia bacterium]|nr:hypothetical protein [Clostridia bacterium]